MASAPSFNDKRNFWLFPDLYCSCPFPLFFTPPNSRGYGISYWRRSRSFLLFLSFPRLSSPLERSSFVGLPPPHSPTWVVPSLEYSSNSVLDLPPLGGSCPCPVKSVIELDFPLLFLSGPAATFS